MPEGWAWCRLGYICSLYDGDKIEKQLQYLDAKHFRGKSTTICNSGKYVAENSYLILVDGENSGEVFYTETAGFQGSTFKILNINTIIFNKYVLYLIRKEQDLLRNSKVGSAIPHLNKQLFKDLLIPIPSFLEQKKLVSTTDKAFNTIDELENNKIELSTVITKTKAKILDLAIHGKLVPQDANEEPASVLLEKLRAEKEEKIAKGELKRDKNDSYIYKGSDNCYYQRFADGREEDISDEIPFEVPSNWTWTRIGAISNKITDGEHNTPKRVSTFQGFYLLSARNIQNGYISLNDVDYVDEDEFLRIHKRCNPQKGDVLISCSGSVGRCTVIEDNNKYVMVRSAAMISSTVINTKYLMYVIQSQELQNQIEDSSKQTAQANLFQAAIADLLIPLPPSNEQSRIINKIEELYIKLELIMQNID